MGYNVSKIGVGGGCHWCTEAVFNALKGVEKVEQGYLSAYGENKAFSEGVIIQYRPEEISLRDLVKVHLYTHASTSAHSFRKKYRSAIYCFDTKEIKVVEKILTELQNNFEEKLITKALVFQKFEASREQIQDYYEKNKNAPFCERYIIPKLQLLKDSFKELEV
jgi:peptide-methionine (S)-S-oxide reductase